MEETATRVACADGDTVSGRHTPWLAAGAKEGAEVPPCPRQQARAACTGAGGQSPSSTSQGL